MQSYYERITLVLTDEQVAKQVQEMSLTDFQRKTHPVYFRNSVGELTPAVPNSPEAGYKRDPDNGYVLTKL